MNVYAGEPKELELPPIGPTGFFDPGNTQTVIGIIVGGFITLMLIGAGLWALIQLIFAGYAMISSGGDKQALEAARGKLTWAIIGLIVVLAAWGLVIFVQNVLGICLGVGDCPISITPPG